MRLRTAIVTIAVVLAAIGIYHYTFSSPWRVTPEVARMLLEAKKIDLVLDVRTGLERETLGKYPGSSHIPSGDLERVILDRVRDRGTVILVYCNTGQRARRAVEVLRELGYKRVMYIAGTWKSLT
jgi:rhodanese-related sulfurtransferase